MLDKDIKIIQPTVYRKPSRKRGPLSSEELNTFQDQVVFDITNISSATNTLNNNISNANLQLYTEIQYLSRKLKTLEEQNKYVDFVNGKSFVKVISNIDFHDGSNIKYPSNIPPSKFAEYNSQFGEIFLPAIAIENKFYTFSLKNKSIISPNDLLYEIKGTFDKGDGNGTQDYEKGGLVYEGDPLNAFNGIDEKVWIRKVTFPLESNVDEVEVQLTAVVPSGFSSEANVLDIVPFPEGSVDILQVSTSPNLSSAFVSLETFLEQNNSIPTRYHFSPRSVQQVRIVLRCRHWKEISGKKVFVYGLRELGLKLVDYNKTYTSSDSLGQNMTSVIKIDAPKDHVFKNLFRIDPNPNFFLEDTNNRHVRLRLSYNQDHSGVIWDSATNIAPQFGVSNGIAIGGHETIYALYTFKFVDSSGGYNSPFPIGTTPTAKSLGLVYSISSK